MTNLEQSAVPVTIIPKEPVPQVPVSPFHPRPIVLPQNPTDMEAATNLAVADTFPSLIQGVPPEEIERQFDTTLQKIRYEPKKFYQEKATERYKENTDQLLDFLENTPANELQGLSGGLQSYIQDTQAEVGDPMTPFRAMAAKLLPDSPRIIQEQAAAQLFGEQVLQEYNKDKGWGEATSDFFGWFLSDLPIDLLGTGINTNTPAQFQALDPSLKPGVFLALFEIAKKARGNNRAKVTALMRTFLDEGGSKDLAIALGLDWVGIASMPFDLYGLAKMFKGFIPASVKTTKLLAEGGEPLKAGAMNAMMLEKGFATRIAGDPVVAFSNATAFPNELLLGPTFTANIANPTLQVLTNKAAEGAHAVRSFMARAFDTEFALRPEVPFDAEAIKLKQDATAALMKTRLEAEYANSAVRIGDMEMTPNPNGKGFQVSFKLKNSITDTDFRVFENHAFTLDEMGVFQLAPINPAKSLVASEKLILEGLQSRMVEGAELGLSLEHKFNKLLHDGLSRAIAPIKRSWGKGKRAKIKEVEEVLLRGDELADGGRRFSTEELTELGIELKDGRRVYLDPGQSMAYYNYLEIADFAYIAGNINLRRSLELLGMKHIKVFDNSVYGKVIDSAASLAGTKQAAASGLKHYHVGQGFQDLSTLKWEKLEQNGEVLVHLRESIPIMKDEVTGLTERSSYVVVKKTQVGDLPFYIRPRRNAYVPKINLNVRYVVKEHIPERMDGIGVPANHQRNTGDMLRGFDSKKEADQYAADLTAANTQENKIFTVHDDLDRSYKGALDTEGKFGPFGSAARSTKDIRFGIDGAELERMGPMQALSRNMDILAKKLPVAEWRLGMEKMFIKTVNAQKDMTPIGNFNDALSGPDDKIKALTAARDYLKEQFHVSTGEESWWDAMARRSASWMEGRPYFDTSYNTIFRDKPWNMRRTVLSWADLDPLGAARSAAFHSLLGWFNPAQLFVQAQGASIAVSLHPLEAPRALANYMGMRAAYYSKSPEYIKNVARATMNDPEEFAAMLEQFRRTGLAESIKDTGDLTGVTQGYGVTRGMFSAAASKGLMFYREGELMHRMTSYGVARQQILAGKSGIGISDDIQRQIFEKAMDYSLSMSAASRAVWQKGVLGVSTQFMQVQARFVEAILPAMVGGSAKFTGMEKFRLLISQSMLYGAAGFPFGGYVVESVRNMFGKGYAESREEGSTVKDYALWRQGLVGWMFGEGQLTIAGRSALASDLERMVLDLYYEDVDVQRAVLGAFGNVLDRTGKAFGFLEAAVYNGSFDIRTATSALNRIAEITSTWSNLNKAYEMYTQNQYLDSRGVTVAEGFTPIELWGQALGFAPSRVADIYKVMNTPKRRSEYQQAKAKAILQIANDYMITNDDESRELARKHMEYAFSSLQPEDSKAVKQIIRNILTGKSKESQALKAGIKEMTSRWSDKLALGQLFTYEEENK